MSSTNHYKDSIHILFKMKANGGLAVGTAAMISQPKLPLDNLMLVETIETYLAKKTEMKIRVENFNGNKAIPKVLVATISGYSKKSNGRVEMGHLKDKLCKELESSQQQEKLRVEYEETAKKKDEEKSRRNKKAEEDLKKRSVKDPKRKSEFLKADHGGTAKKRLVYDDVLPTQSILQNRPDRYSSLDDMFAENIISDYSDVESEEESVNESVNESRNGSDESGEESNNAHQFLENEEGSFLAADTECWPSETGRLITVLEQIGAPTVLQTNATPHVDSTALSRNTPNISSRTQEITELKQRVSDLEAENGFLFHQIDEKDLEISSLKAEVIELKNKQPDNLVEKLSAALSLANGLNTRNSSNDDADAATHNVSRHSTSREQVMVQLVQGHNLRIEKSDLKFAITIGRLSKSNLHPMINKILESIYTRVYMSEHSLSGKAPRFSRAYQSELNTPPRPVKPGLPKEDVVTIILFMFQAWKTYHGDVIQPKQVREAIRSSKLSTETRALLSAMLTPPPEPASRAVNSTI